MKVLLDHNLDWRLKNYLPGHEINTVFEMGWSDLLNGELLDSAVESGFDVLLTGDSNIKHQQNMQVRSIAIVVLRAANNTLKSHAPMMPRVAETLKAIEPGQLIEIENVG